MTEPVLLGIALGAAMWLVSIPINFILDQMEAS